MPLFQSTFLSVFQGLIQILIIASIAGWFTHKKIVSQDIIDGLSKLTVKLLLPFLIFYTITSEFNPGEQSYWWMVPLIIIFISSTGLLYSLILFFRGRKKKKHLFPLASMQNAVYLILPIGEFVYPEQFEEFSLICFLVVLGMSPFMWTVGKLLSTEGDKGEKFYKKILTPPFIANILSIILVLTGLNRFIPDFVSDTTQFLGRATVPLASFILGATIAGSFRGFPRFGDAFVVLMIKFLLIPLSMIGFLLLTGLHREFPLLADVLVIQSASAPATAHILMIRTYGGQIKAAGSIIFLGYLICIIAIPFWISFWKFAATVG